MLTDTAAGRSALRAESGQQQDHASPPTTLADRSDIAWYDAGLRDGIAIGRQLEADEMAACWAEFAKPVARSLARNVGLEQRRWTLRGEARTRQAFSRPHSDDYPGRGGAAA